MIGIMGISQHLLVFISVLSLTGAQPSPEATITPTSSEVTSSSGATNDTTSTTVTATTTLTSSTVTSGISASTGTTSTTVTATTTPTSSAVTSDIGTTTGIISTTVSATTTPTSSAVTSGIGTTTGTTSTTVSATTTPTSSAVTSGIGTTTGTTSTYAYATTTPTSSAVTSGIGTTTGIISTTVTATTTPTSSTVTSGIGTTTGTTSTTVSEIFYPFGLKAGDVVIANETSSPVNLSRPFRFFGRTYNRTYVNNNGLLSFSREIPEMDPVTFPSHRNEDLIAPLWTDLDDGAYYYQEYTTGIVLTRATEDIQRYYPGRGFNATWVFVATWDFVKTSNKNAIQFQVVLISDGNSSFILMNYGDIGEIDFPVEAGYDTVGSTHYFDIPGSNHGSLVPSLKTTSNVNVPGRWAFSANQGIVQFAETFYPVGLAAGDSQTVVVAVTKFILVNLSRPYLFFGRKYNQIYVNSKGLLSFRREISHAGHLPFPYAGEDLIAPFWTDLDNYGYGAIYHQEYTTGNVLARATKDIKHYYPGLRFNATWVFVATWDFVESFDPNVFLHHSAPAISFQVVLISDGAFSFILMNYGDIGAFYHPVQAGYDTISSTNYFIIPGLTNWNLVPNLKNTSNVNVPGRWAFVANKNTVIGLQVKVSSYLNLSENVTFLLEKLKYELVRRNLTSDVKLTARRVQKINL